MKMNIPKINLLVRMTSFGATYSYEKKQKDTTITDYMPIKYDDFIHRLNVIRKIDMLSNVLIATFLLSFIHFFIITGLVGVILKICTYTILSLSIRYEYSDDYDNSQNNFTVSCEALRDNSSLWFATSVRDKYSAKIRIRHKENIKRRLIRGRHGLVHYIKSDYTPVTLRCSGKKLIFLPDRLLVFEGLHILSISHSDISLTFEKIYFSESRKTPSDTHVVTEHCDNIIRDANTKLDPSNPICEYGLVTLRSRNGLNVSVLCSNPATIDVMRRHNIQLLVV